MPNPEVAIIIKAKDSASSVLSGIGDKLGGLGKMAGIGAVAGVAALAGLGVAAFKLGSDFDAAYDKIQIKTGQTGEKLGVLKADFKAVFADIPTTMEAASTAISDLSARLGLTGEPLRRMSEQLLELSRITETDLSTNISESTRMFGDWSIASDKQSGALDKVFRASQLTGVGIEGLMQRVVQFGAPLRALGFEFEDSIAMLAKWEKEGVNVDTVLASLKIAVGKFAKAEADGTGTGKTLNESLWDTFAAIKGNVNEMEAMALGMEVFGSRAGPDMVMAIREGRFEFEDLTKAMEGADGAIIKTGKDTMDAGEKFTIMKNKLKVAIEPVVSKIFDLVGVLADKLIPVIGLVSEWVEDKAGPAFEKWLPIIADIGREIGDKIVPVLKTFGEKVKTAWDVIDGIVGKKALIAGALAVIAVGFAALAISAGSAAIGVVIALAPIIAIVAVIAGVGALIYKAWTENWGGIQEKTAAVVENIVGKVSVFVNEMKIRFSQFVAFIKPLMEPAWENIKSAMSNIVKFFKENWDKVEKIFNGVWKVIQGLIRVAWDVVSGIIKVGMALLAGDWDKAWTALKTMVNGIWDDIKLIISGATDVIGAALGIAWGGIQTAAKWAWEGIRDNIFAIVNWIIDYSIRPLIRLINDVIYGINLIKPGADIGYVAEPGRLVAPGGPTPEVGREEAGGWSLEPHYQYGAWRIPGPMGMPVRAIVHGGEEILTPRQREPAGTTILFDFTGADLGGLTEERVEQIFKERLLQERLQGIRY